MMTVVAVVVATVQSVGVIKAEDAATGDCEIVGVADEQAEKLAAGLAFGDVPREVEFHLRRRWALIDAHRRSQRDPALRWCR